jgi:hypothetical protein
VAHLRVEAGMEAKDGLIPYAALGALRHRQGAFAETGADGLGLAARSDTHTVTYGETGLRLNLVTDGGAAWRGFLGGRWTLSGRDVGYAATFAGAPEVTFATNGQRLPSGVMRAGLGYFSADKDGWQWFAEGVVEGTSDGLRDGRIGVGVRWTF